MISSDLARPDRESAVGPEALEVTLEVQLRQSGARLGLIVDRSGAVLASAGSRGELADLTLGALMAAHFGANRHLASLVGESDFRCLFHQGHRSSIFLSDLAEDTILAVLYDGLQPESSLSRAGDRIASELAPPVRDYVTAAPAGRSGIFGSDWTAAVENEIDRVFREGA